eukprot:UN27257
MVPNQKRNFRCIYLTSHQRKICRTFYLNSQNYLYCQECFPMIFFWVLL